MEKEKIIKYAAIAAGLLLLYMYIKKRQRGGIFAAAPANSELTELIESDQSGVIQGAATISATQAANIANRIKGAWGIFNDDEEAIFAAMQELRTLADLLLVSEKYGYYQPNALVQAEDLATSLRTRLNKKELEKVNKILSDRKIDYTF